MFKSLPKIQDTSDNEFNEYQLECDNSKKSLLIENLKETAQSKYNIYFPNYYKRTGIIPVNLHFKNKNKGKKTYGHSN